MRNWLQGQFVVLSGASSGIGRALTKLLIVKYGAKVIGIGRNEEKMRSLQTELGSFTNAFSFSLFDVSEKSAWQIFADGLREKGISPTLLINNAGVFPPLQKALRLPSTEAERILKNNFLSAVYAIEEMKGFPSIAFVQISSSAALCPVVGSAVYSASKSALKGYTEGLQLEEKGRYIGIFYPGTTATDLFRDDENVRGSAMDKIACSPEKMAKKIAKKIRKRKKRGVLGLDAKIMYFLAKIAPVKGPAFLRWVMKISKSKAFKNVN